MIAGRFSDGERIIVDLTITGFNDEQMEIEAVVDTGYVGALLLPASVVMHLNLSRIDEEVVMLADGSRTRLPLYEVTIHWEEKEQTVSAHMADGNALIGMELLQGSTGYFEFFDGGTVTIEPGD